MLMISPQTLRTLWSVDHNVVEAYYARALQGDLTASLLQGSEDLASRLLEILDITCGHDGEVYVHQLKNVLKTAEGDGPLKQRPVLEEVVEEMLHRF